MTPINQNGITRSGRTHWGSGSAKLNFAIPVRLALVLLLLMTTWGSANVQDVPPTPDRPSTDTDELAKRLLDGAGGSGDVMDRILALMRQSGRRLDIDFDPGVATQAVQTRILEELDNAVKAAAQKRRRQSKSESTSAADKRRPTSDKTQTKPGDHSSSAPESGATPTANKGDHPADTRTGLGALRESRRGWGRLPERDREQILQGADESTLQRYKAWIDRYYRALQDDDNTD